MMLGVAPRLLVSICFFFISSLCLADGSNSPTAGKHLLFVVQKAAEPEVLAADALARAHFEAMGFMVSLADHDDPADLADDNDLVVISSSVSGHTIAGRYRHTPVPVITWEAYILDDMAMTGKTEDRDFGTDERERHLWLVNAPHPLAGGLPAGMHNVYTRNGSMNWGKPGLGATIIATLPGQPEQAGIFAYETGATMDYESLAPARRAFLFLDNTTFGLANDAGTRLIDAALRWAVSEP